MIIVRPDVIAALTLLGHSSTSAKFIFNLLLLSTLLGSLIEHVLMIRYLIIFYICGGMFMLLSVCPPNMDKTNFTKIIYIGRNMKYQWAE